MFSTTAGETTYYGNIFFIVAIFAMSCGFFTRNLARYYYLIPLAILLNYLMVRWLGTYNLLWCRGNFGVGLQHTNVHPQGRRFRPAAGGVCAAAWVSGDKV